jgi:enoyl-CoA hydratase/carnithine racemase
VSEQDQDVLCSVEDSVAVVTLNRPERMNAVTPSLAKSYVATLHRLDDDPAVRAIVVTGAGRAFCAGADLGELAKGIEHLEREFAGPGIAPETAMLVRKPVVAAVNGAAAGLGFAYLLACDIRFFDAGAKVQTSFAKLGLVAEYGMSWLLPRIVGRSRATELLLSSRPLGAEEAARIGLAHAVTEPGATLADALAYARELVATGAPSSWAAMKEQLLADGATGFEDALTAAYPRMARAFHGPDIGEALAARTEKRPPQFHELAPRTPLRT